MTIEIEIPASALFKVFETSEVSDATIHTAPGGAILRLGKQKMEKRWHSAFTEPLVPIAVTFGSGVAINLFSSWLWEKLKGGRTTKIRINRVEIETQTPDAITKVISESIEVEN